MRDRAAYILVGGKSSRFGSDKALVEIEGRPLVLRLADIAREAAGKATLVGPADRYQHLGVPVIPDSHRETGPLAGILAALEHSQQRWNLVLACDMPLIRATFLDLLFTEAEEGDADVVMPVSPGGRDEPLCAVYGQRAAAAIRHSIENGTRKITHALAALSVHRLLPDEYRDLDPTGKTFTNVNTAGDLRQASSTTDE